MLLEVSGVVAGYGGGNVLQGVDLAVEEGSITCIVGPNGAGKSTVLRTVSGLLRPSAGTISLDGREIGGRDCAEILACGVVQVPQSDALFPKMTTGAMPNASINPAASSDCSLVEVLSQPSGRGLRELARRS